MPTHTFKPRAGQRADAEDPAPTGGESARAARQALRVLRCVSHALPLDGLQRPCLGEVMRTALHCPLPALRKNENAHGETDRALLS